MCPSLSRKHSLSVSVLSNFFLSSSPSPSVRARRITTAYQPHHKKIKIWRLSECVIYCAAVRRAAVSTLSFCVGRISVLIAMNGHRFMHFRALRTRMYSPREHGDQFNGDIMVLLDFNTVQPRMMILYFYSISLLYSPRLTCMTKIGFSLRH